MDKKNVLIQVMGLFYDVKYIKLISLTNLFALSWLSKIQVKDTWFKDSFLNESFYHVGFHWSRKFVVIFNTTLKLSVYKQNKNWILLMENKLLEFTCVVYLLKVDFLLTEYAEDQRIVMWI